MAISTRPKLARSGVAGVGADAHAAGQGQARGSLHGDEVAGMTAAGDIGGGDVV
jgi:hypothetical protein